VIILLNEFTDAEHRTPTTERQQVIDSVNRYNTLFAAQPQSVSLVCCIVLNSEPVSAQLFVAFNCLSTTTILLILCAVL